MCQASEMSPRLCRIVPCRRALVVVWFFCFWDREVHHRCSIDSFGGGLKCRQGFPWGPRGRATRPWPAKTPPGSCSVALSDRSQCDSTGPAAVWADDQAVTRALQARKSPRQICAKGWCLLTATSPQDPAASGKTCPSQYQKGERSVPPAEVLLNTGMALAKGCPARRAQAWPLTTCY